VLDLFREKSTIDELGLGTIRNAFADMLFRGTSAPQIRARYFLFVPWIYLRLERQRISSAEIARRARRLETQLIESLLECGESDGVIGRLRIQPAIIDISSVRSGEFLNVTPDIFLWRKIVQ